jgi:hypothetical protein
MVMERLGWKKTGKKGSLGVRAKVSHGTSTPGAYHNTGGLAFWFLRAERYEHPDRVSYPTVRARARKLKTPPAKPLAHEKRSKGSRPGPRLLPKDRR